MYILWCLILIILGITVIMFVLSKLYGVRSNIGVLILILIILMLILLIWIIIKYPILIFIILLAVIFIKCNN
jgi:hypothetical protein